jgi:hypothetical protein
MAESADAQDIGTRRKRLLQKITQLGKTEHTEILKICQVNNVVLTHTRLNGVFFNMTSLPDAVFDEIERFVTYCHANKTALDEYDHKLQECKLYKSYKPHALPTYGVIQPADIVRKNNIQDLMDCADKDTSKRVTDFIRKLNIGSENASASTNRNRASSKYAAFKKRYAKKPTVADVSLIGMELGRDDA